MGPKEIKTVIRLANQYLDPRYNDESPGGADAQRQQEEGVFKDVIAELAKKDQDVLKVWKLAQKAKRED